MQGAPPLVNWYLSVLLKHENTCGGFDIGGLNSLTLGVSDGSETWQAIGSDKGELVKPGVFGYQSDGKMLSMHLCWRQSVVAAISETTKDAIFLSEVLPGHTPETLPDDLLKAFVEGSFC